MIVAARQPRALLICPSSAGLLNHSVALTQFLAADGWKCSIVSGPEAFEHLAFVGCEELLLPCEAHSLDFLFHGHTRRGHVQQICAPEYLTRAVETELSLFDRERPDIIITKNFFSVPISSSISHRRWAPYLTGGPLHLTRALNPLVRPRFHEAFSGFRATCQRFGLPCLAGDLCEALRSPYLNLVRGLPELGAPASPQESVDPSIVTYLGCLTFDGGSASAPQHFSWPLRRGRKLFVSMGTTTNNPDVYRQILEACRLHPEWNVVMTSFNIPIDSTVDSVKTYRYVPNSLALRAAECVVHHGGYGTALECTLHGVPQLILPQNTATSCQALQGRFFETLGVAVALDKSEQSAENIGKAAEYLLSAPVKARAQNLKEDCIFASRNAQSKALDALRDLLYEGPRGSDTPGKTP